MTTAQNTAVIAPEKAANGLSNPGVGKGYRCHPTWSYLHCYPDGDIWDARLGRYRKQSDNGQGYRVIKVEGKQYKVHRLVAEAWFGADVYSEEKHLTRHRNGKKTENCFWNLMPGDHLENAGDRMVHAGNESSDHCNRGHHKSGSNLVPSQTKIGKSECRACGNARSRAKNWRKAGRTVTEEMIQRWADEYLLRYTADTLGTLAFAVTATATAPHLMATA